MGMTIKLIGILLPKFSLKDERRKTPGQCYLTYYEIHGGLRHQTLCQYDWQTHIPTVVFETPS